MNFAREGLIFIVIAALIDRMPAYVSGRMHPDHSLLTLGDDAAVF